METMKFSNSPKFLSLAMEFSPYSAFNGHKSYPLHSAPTLDFDIEWQFRNSTQQQVSQIGMLIAFRMIRVTLN